MFWLQIYYLERAVSCSSPYGNHVAGAVEVTEAALVRDILYVFQGIDGRNIKMSSADNCYKVEGKVRCPDPLQPSRVRVTAPGPGGSRWSGRCCSLTRVVCRRGPGPRTGSSSVLTSSLVWCRCQAYLPDRCPGICALTQAPREALLPSFASSGACLSHSPCC